ncbi:3558_t:CDS:1, partial [Racocetra fulgida]
IYGYSEIDENETPNCLSVPSPPDTPVLDSPIDVLYSNSHLLPLSPNDKDTNIPLLNMPALHTSRPININDLLPSTSSVQPFIDVCSFSIPLENCQCREILVPPPN